MSTPSSVFNLGKMDLHLVAFRLWIQPLYAVYFLLQIAKIYCFLYKLRCARSQDRFLRLPPNLVVHFNTYLPFPRSQCSKIKSANSYPSVTAYLIYWYNNKNSTKFSNLSLFEVGFLSLNKMINCISRLNFGGSHFAQGWRAQL